MNEQEAIKTLRSATWHTAFPPQAVQAAALSQFTKPHTLVWMPMGPKFGTLVANIGHNRTAIRYFAGSDDHGPYLEGTCSCSGKNCVHSYMAVRHWLGAPPPSASETFRAWAKTTKIAAPAQVQDIEDSAESVARLNIEILNARPEFTPTVPHALTVAVGAFLRHATRANEAVSALSERDFDDYALLRAQPTALRTVEHDRAYSAFRDDFDGRDTGPPQYQLLTASQDAALLRALENGCVLHGSTVVTPGPELTYTPQWIVDQDGTQRLAMMDADGHRAPKLLFGHGGFYVATPPRVPGKPIRVTMGRAHCDRAVVEALDSAPSVLAEHSRDVIEVLCQEGGPVPPPHDAVDIKTQRGAPTPILSLTTRDRAQAAGSLSFRYGDFELKPEDFGGGDSVVRPTSKGLRRIKRNYTAELEAAEALRAKGFIASALRADIYGQNHSSAVVLPATLASHPARLLNAASALEQAGIGVRHDVAFIDVDADSTSTHVAEDGSQWFTLDVTIEIDGRKHSLVSVLAAVIEDPAFSLTPPDGEDPERLWTLALDDGQLVRLPVGRVRKLIEPIADLLQAAQRKNGAIRASRLQLAVVADALHECRAAALPELRTAIARVRGVAELPLPSTPANFDGVLRDYQLEGLRWLNALAEGGLGGVLADDMGIGKTIEILAHVQWLKNEGRLNAPVMVAMPASVVGNWQAESAKFTPSLKVLTLTGPDRKTRFDQIPQHDIVLTSYPLILRDVDLYAGHPFSLVVADEAQYIQGQTKTAMAVRTIKAERAVPLTGTPIQNNLLELWSSFDLSLPGLLGDRTYFKRAYSNPIEKARNADRLGHLTRRIRPFMLRRTKDEVAKDLPPKTEVIRDVLIEGPQRTLYDAIHALQTERVRAAIKASGLAQSAITVLSALTMLRQVCCSPKLLKGDYKKSATDKSSKLDELFAMLEELRADGSRTLVVSNFTEMLALIEEGLRTRGIDYAILTGDTPTAKRPAIIAGFQAGTQPVFLLSTKAGGVGINLTAADTVIHYDPWWNPAAEDQATDRAHRIGQTKPVFVYRLICQDTVEIWIQKKKAEKSALAAAVLSGGVSSGAQFSEQDIAELFGIRVGE